MLFTHLTNLLQSKCFGCHCLRLSALESRNARLKLDLLERGLVREALEVDAALPPVVRQLSKEDAKVQGEETVERREGKAGQALARFEALVAAAPVARETTQARSEYLKLTKQVLAASKVRCARGSGGGPGRAGLTLDGCAGADQVRALPGAGQDAGPAGAQGGPHAAVHDLWPGQAPAAERARRRGRRRRGRKGERRLWPRSG
jgi:hypothetical protein